MDNFSDTQDVMILVALRPYIVKTTGTRPISEVKPLMAQSVLWLGTTWEYWVS
ncbi:7429_t:CDS:2 [Entrophospora sp. SA101]|nr:7429_t:CDS:2 [Entrophospora sp. SA101]